MHGKTQAPAAIAAQSALAVASLAVQGFADVETLDGARPVGIYFLTVARSGERKSACDRPFLTAIRARAREDEIAYRADRDDWKRRHAIWKAQSDGIVSASKKGDRLAGEAKLRELGPEPQPPRLVDRTVTEPTFEGLTKLFAEGQPSLGLFSDEGGQFLGGHAMNSDNRQKTLAALNALWDGHPIKRTRAGDGHTSLHNRRLAIHLMVQPTVARAFMADPLEADTGFLPRFLMCEPPSTIGTRLHANAKENPSALASFERRLGDILGIPMPIDPETGGLQLRCLPLSAEARALLVEYHDKVERSQSYGGEMANLTGTASKSAEQAARLAGVLTLWRDLEAVEVAAADMASAIELARFYLLEAARLAEVANVSAEIDRAEQLRRWLLESWPEPEVTVRDVVNRGPNALRDSPTARAALSQLETHGWLVRLDKGTVVRGSSRKEAWRVVRSGGAG
ncbi:MAG: YfjI family protein [Erythrobacter sp.]